MLVPLPRRCYAGRRWLAAFATLYAISLAAELLGTSLGIPFGEYSYTPLLGIKWFGLVPLVIPLSWFFMALPSYALALRALPEPGRPGGGCCWRRSSWSAGTWRWTRP